MKDLNYYKLFTLMFVMMACNVGAYAYEDHGTSEQYDPSTHLLLHTNLNFVEFDVLADEDGEYYLEFWLMPAKHADNTYTQYVVNVNNVYAGMLNPTFGNWQSIRIDGNRKISLKKGVNRINVGAPSPEYPMVESIRISQNDTGALYSSNEYYEYLAKAKEGVSLSNSTSEHRAYDWTSPTGSSTEFEFYNVPLEYTFNTIKEFYEGQDIFISTSSKIENDIDMVYLGQPISFDIGGSEREGSIASVSDIEGIALPRPRPKFLISYTSATSEEMQGLNWRGRSEYSLNSTSHLATIHTIIPKSGYYVLRVRADKVGQIGVADININGDYFYEDVPISYNQVPYTIPADGCEYACIAKSANPDVDDPLLFMQSYLAERVVGFADDCTTSQMRSYNLGWCDAYFAQVYKVKTSGISVSNYSSVSPKSTCSIIVRKFDSSNKMAKSNTSVNDDIADGYIDGKPYVDLGLPSGTLWAIQNLGADNSYEYGDYYAWGETAPKNEYDWDNYMYFDRQIMDPQIGLWCVTEDIGEDIQYTRHDAASAEWGDNWGMPTEEQLRELRRLCWHEWVEENGVCGVRVHGPNKHSIFLPAGGIVEKKGDSAPPYANLDGLYWGSTQSVLTDISASCNQAAYVLAFDRGGFGVVNRQDKCSGINIRPVANSGALSSVTSIVDEEIRISCSQEEIVVEGCECDNRIEIYNLSGQLLISGKADGNTFRHVFSGKGVYIVAVSDGKTVKKIKKLIL